MALGIALAGTIDSDRRLKLGDIREWLSRAAVWFESAGDAVVESRLTRDTFDHPLLHVHFHPAGEPAQLRVGNSGKVSVHARTTPIGPGYHAHLCELLKDFAEDFDIQWNDPNPDRDPAQYFSHGDLARLERQFLHWLGQECSKTLRYAEPDRVLALGMPRPLRFVHSGPVLTPLGPRSIDWLKSVSGDPKAGIDFFPWWSPELDAAFYRRRAETDLWLAFPWREPLTESEGEVVDQIAADLANAYEADPSGALPWSAWAATLAALRTDAGKFTVEPVPEELAALVFAQDDGSAATLGYRRHPISTEFSGGWTLRIPGRLAVRREEDGRTWTAWDDTITIWLRDQSLGQTERGAGPAAAQALATARRNLPPGEPINHAGERGILGDAVWGTAQDDGRTVGRLNGIAVAGNRLAVCNIYLRDATDRDRAVGIWRSLHRA
jgi:hypothetical protein